MPEESLTRADCARILRISTRQWDRLVHDGLAPQPSRAAGSRRPRWTHQQIEAFRAAGIPPRSPQRLFLGSDPKQPTPWQ
jgi:hypothetical protein